MEYPFSFNKPKFCDIVVLTNLVSLRKLKGFSQTKLGELCDVSKNAISNIETGKCLPSLTLVVKLCLALDCKFSDLVDVYDWCAFKVINL